MPLGVVGIIPEDINDHGVICGTWRNLNVPGVSRGFVRWADGSYTELDTLSGAGWGTAHAINNNNVVVGERATGPSTTPRVAFVWTQANGFVDIGYPQYRSSFASDISDTGVVVGAIYTPSNVFYWESGQLTLLGNAPGSSSLVSVAIGQSGGLPIVGSAQHAGPEPFTWNNNFAYLPLLAKHNRGGAHAVRDHPKQIVGHSWRSQTFPPISEFRGVIWVGATINDLNNLTVAPTTIREAVDITIDGVILAVGGGRGLVLQPINASSSDLDGDCRVNVFDLELLFDQWNQVDSPGDLNQSGRVDVADLFILLSDWTG